jgi:hypothetical protein
MPKPSLGPRIDAWAKRNPTIVVVSLAAVLVAAVVTIVGAGKGIVGWYEDTFDWRAKDYARLTGLRAGFALPQFEHTLGTPLFVRIAPHTHLREETFRGHGYWAQTLSDEHGSVVLYAVTACEPGFRPTFTLPPYEGKPAHVTLGQTVPAAVLSGFRRKLVKADYFLSTATADIYAYDVWAGANPGFYKTYVWGLNDACPGFYRYLEGLRRRRLIPGYAESHYSGYVASAGPAIMRFRSKVPANTYAETEPLNYLFELGKGVHIGVDRILVRTVTGEN